MADTPLVAALALLLNAAGVGAYSPKAVLPDGAVPIMLNGWPPKSDTAIVLTTYTGAPSPDSWNGWESPRLQVKVRAKNVTDAIRLERATWRALQFEKDGANVPRLVSGWWLQDCAAMGSDAEPLGQDEQGRWMVVRNYQLDVKPPEGI